MPESPAVAAFIAQRQFDVLTRGVEALRSTSPEALQEQVHRLMGTFGTYQIDDAVAAITPLHELLRSPDPSAVTVEREKTAALASLDAVLKDRGRQQ